MLCDNSPLTVQQFGQLLLFLESILFFSYDFKNIEHLIILVNSNAASESLIIFVALMVSLST